MILTRSLLYHIEATVHFISCKFTKPKEQSQSTKLTISKLRSWWHWVIYTCSYNLDQLLIVSLPQRTPFAHYTSNFFLPGPDSCDSISFTMNLLFLSISHTQKSQNGICVEWHQIVHLPYIWCIGPKTKRKLCIFKYHTISLNPKLGVLSWAHRRVEISVLSPVWRIRWEWAVDNGGDGGERQTVSFIRSGTYLRQPGSDTERSLTQTRLCSWAVGIWTVPCAEPLWEKLK